MTEIVLLACLLGFVLYAFLQHPPAPRERRDPPPEEEYLQDVKVEAVDGDTLRVEGLPRTVRLARVDTPEKGTPGARAATEAVREALDGAGTVEIRGQGRGKWGRHIAEVVVDGENLSDVLLRRGLAREVDW